MNNYIARAGSVWGDMITPACEVWQQEQHLAGSADSTSCRERTEDTPKFGLDCMGDLKSNENAAAAATAGAAVPEDENNEDGASMPWEIRCENMNIVLPRSSESGDLVGLKCLALAVRSETTANTWRAPSKEQPGPIQSWLFEELPVGGVYKPACHSEEPDPDVGCTSGQPLYIKFKTLPEQSARHAGL